MKRIGKTLAILALTVAVLAVTTMGAFAQGPSPADQTDARAGGVRGIVIAKEPRGFAVVTLGGDLRRVAVDHNTKFRQPGQPSMTYKDLEVGDLVTVVGRAEQGAPLLAKLVTVRAVQPRLPRLLGTVTEVGPHSLTVKTMKGQSVTVKMDDKTRVFPKETQIKVDDKVLVIGAPNHTQAVAGSGDTREILARLIVVKGAKTSAKI